MTLRPARRRAALRACSCARASVIAPPGAFPVETKARFGRRGKSRWRPRRAGALIFLGPVIEAEDRRNAYGETRLRALGEIDREYDVVVSTWRGENRRIISAWKVVGVRPSMGSVGDAYDNAMCESFFSTLECELLSRRKFASQAEAKIACFSYIEGFYNPVVFCTQNICAGSPRRTV